MDFAQLISQMSPEELQQLMQLSSTGESRDQLQQQQMGQLAHQGQHHSFLGGFLGGFAPGVGNLSQKAMGNKQDAGRGAYIQALVRALQGGGGGASGMGPLEMGQGGF